MPNMFDYQVTKFSEAQSHTGLGSWPMTQDLAGGMANLVVGFKAS